MLTACRLLDPGNQSVLLELFYSGTRESYGGWSYCKCTPPRSSLARLNFRIMAVFEYHSIELAMSVYRAICE